MKIFVVNFLIVCFLSLLFTSEAHGQFKLDSNQIEELRMTTLIIIELDTIPNTKIRSWIKKKNWKQNIGIRRFQFRMYKWFPDYYKKKQLKILSKYNYKYRVIKRSQWEAEKEKCIE